jgi:hypothetical protein
MFEKDNILVRARWRRSKTSEGWAYPQFCSRLRNALHNLLTPLSTVGCSYVDEPDWYQACESRGCGRRALVSRQDNAALSYLDNSCGMNTLALHSRECASTVSSKVIGLGYYTLGKGGTSLTL